MLEPNSLVQAKQHTAKHDLKTTPATLMYLDCSYDRHVKKEGNQGGAQPPLQRYV